MAYTLVGKMSMPFEMLSEPVSYYISSLRRRKELIPVPERRAYRCITSVANEPIEGDMVIMDQVAFENILIGLGVYSPRNSLSSAVARVWRGLHIDQLAPLKKYKEPQESLLYLLDSPYRNT